MSTPTIYALLVSVGTVTAVPNLPPLRSASGDLALMHRALREGLRLSDDNIRQLGAGEEQGSGKAGPGQEAGIVTAAALARALRDFDALLQEDDAIIIYYSGHATETALQLTDAQLTIESVLAAIERLRARSKLVILDCCHAGSAKISPAGAGSLTFEEAVTTLAGKGTALLASSARKEASRTLTDGTASIFTAAAAQALTSRRLCRGGALTIRAVAQEVRTQMEEWNRDHPDQQQHPVCRDSFIGTMIIPVEMSADTARPRHQHHLAYDTPRYSVREVKPLSTTTQKRLAAFVILPEHKSADEESADTLAAITKEIADRIKGAAIYAGDRTANIHAGKDADAIWCYFARDELDLTGHNHFACTVWAEDKKLREHYGRQLPHAQEHAGTYISRNKSYAAVRALQTSHEPKESALNEDPLAATKRIAALLIAHAQEFSQALDEAENTGEPLKSLSEENRTWLREVTALYLELTDRPLPPPERREWTAAVLDLAGWVTDLGLWLKRAGKGSEEANARTETKRRTDDPDRWLLHYTLRRYDQALERLREANHNRSNR